MNFGTWHLFLNVHLNLVHGCSCVSPSIEMRATVHENRTRFLELSSAVPQRVITLASVISTLRN